MLQNTSINKAVCAGAASDPALLATDLADYLVKKGMPFRQAHHVVGSVVGFAEKAGKLLNQITLEELKSLDAHFSEDVLHVFDLKRAMGKRTSTGSPGTKEVARQLALWKKKFLSEELAGS